jgi:putative transcriptional regulator
VLVLQRGFRDQFGHYVPGDIAVADGTIDQRPVADRSVECIIFVVAESASEIDRAIRPPGRALVRRVG